MRLTSALQESTANVDEWKKQLQSYKEENQRLKNKYIDLEASKGNVICLQSLMWGSFSTLLYSLCKR